jgi:glutathione S-transferase
MRDFVVHSIPGSPYGRAVLLALEEKGVAYRFAAMAPGDHRSAAYLAKHPFGRVPVLEHGDFTLYETAAILRYLERIFPEPALTPLGAQPAARMDQLMNICDWYFFQGVGNVIAFERVVGPALRGKTPDEAAIAAAMPDARRVFGELARLLGDKPYFCGPDLSLADVMLAPHVDFFPGIPEWDELTGEHAHLQAWLARMNARPSMKATTWSKLRDMATAA